MADTAFQTAYRDEFIAGFEQKQSYFRNSVTTEAVIKGNTATFLVADTGSAAAVTRGVNGLIPPRADNLTQTSATLAEWHDKPRRTNFNIFASQGDGRRILQRGTQIVLNRKIDDLLIAELTTGTNNTGTTGVTASLALFAKAKAILGKGDVDVDEEDNMFCAISPAAEAYLLQVKEFASTDYVDVKPFSGPAMRYRRWMGCNFFVTNRLSGRTTNAEKLLMYHRNAIGFATNVGDMSVMAGYNEEDDYYWARASMFMGPKLLQNGGVVLIYHDGSAY